MARKEIDGENLIGRVERLELRPGDILVCRALQPMRPELRIYLQKQVAREFPNNEVVILDGELELFVIGKPEAEAMAADGAA